MSVVPKAVRWATYERDGFMCACCGATDNLSFQHRRAVGMGGAGKKAAPLTPADGVTACVPCNGRFEADLQREALKRGWKVPRSTPIPCDQIPYFHSPRGIWVLPDRDGGYRVLSRRVATAMLADGYLGISVEVKL